MLRTAAINRKTKETDIKLILDFDTANTHTSINTGIGFFDHMLASMFFYAGFAADLEVKGDLFVDAHHTVEDTGIVIGTAIREALGDKLGIRRFAHSLIPMDEALCRAAIDIGGRAFLYFTPVMPQSKIGEYDSCLTAEFFRALVHNAGITLHLELLHGDNAHHMTEAAFKAFGAALGEAASLTTDRILSTKGVLA